VTHPPPYRIVFTDLAAAFARRHGSLQALEEQVRGEIADLMFSDDVEDDEFSIADLMFHTVTMNDGQEYICTPGQGGDETVLVVDTCSREDMTIQGGPMTGQKLSVPSPDSD
jgi:hypothetical protein